MSYLFDSIDSFTESIEAHFDSVAYSLQETFRTTTWLPESMKPTPPPPSYVPPVMRPPIGYFAASRIWISEHRAVTAAVVAFVGTGAFIVWHRRNSDRAKRRAKRSKHGARTEVVILAGSPHSQMTRALSLDLERRGFIVYIPVNSLSEEQVIQSESRPDIRPLSLDITSVRNLPYSFLLLLLTSRSRRRPKRLSESSATTSQHRNITLQLPPPINCISPHLYFSPRPISSLELFPICPLRTGQTP